jgi:hypothetical protein
MTSISTYSTAADADAAARNFTMDYVAGPSAYNTTFGWRLTNTDNASKFIYGYAYINNSNAWVVSLGDSDNNLVYTSSTSPPIYTGLTPPPKFRVLLTTANNISVSLVNSDNTTREIYNYDSININNFRASFGAQSGTLTKAWTVSYTYIDGRIVAPVPP